MKSGAQRQAKHRRDHERLDLVVSVGTKAQIQRLARQDARSQRECVEALLAVESLETYLTERSRQRLVHLARRAGRTPKAFLADVLRRLVEVDRASYGPILELKASEVHQDDTPSRPPVLLLE